MWCWVQCVASALPSVVVCGRMLPFVTVRCRVLQCAPVWCSVEHRVAVSCRVVAVHCHICCCMLAKALVLMHVVY